MFLTATNTMGDVSNYIHEILFVIKLLIDRQYDTLTDYRFNGYIEDLKQNITFYKYMESYTT